MEQIFNCKLKNVIIAFEKNARFKQWSIFCIIYWQLRINGYLNIILQTFKKYTFLK